MILYYNSGYIYMEKEQAIKCLSDVIHIGVLMSKTNYNFVESLELCHAVLMCEPHHEYQVTT
jgi:hypothetical protein